MNLVGIKDTVRTQADEIKQGGDGVLIGKITWVWRREKTFWKLPKDRK